MIVVDALRSSCFVTVLEDLFAVLLNVRPRTPYPITGGDCTNKCGECIHNTKSLAWTSTFIKSEGVKK